MNPTGREQKPFIRTPITNPLFVEKVEYHPDVADKIRAIQDASPVKAALLIRDTVSEEYSEGYEDGCLANRAIGWRAETSVAFGAVVYHRMDIFDDAYEAEKELISKVYSIGGSYNVSIASDLFQAAVFTNEFDAADRVYADNMDICKEYLFWAFHGICLYDCEDVEVADRSKALDYLLGLTGNKVKKIEKLISMAIFNGNFNIAEKLLSLNIHDPQTMAKEASSALEKMSEWHIAELTHTQEKINAVNIVAAMEWLIELGADIAVCDKEYFEEAADEKIIAFAKKYRIISD